MKVKIATFNILHGYYKDDILESIRTLIEKGADVICLQEVEIQLEEILPSGWQVEYFHGELHGCCLAILWNKSKLNFIKESKILLPISSKKSFLFRFTSFYNLKLQRGIFSINFSMGGKILRINNVHLACESSTSHRIKQLEYFFSQASLGYADFEVFAGDFNTTAPTLFRRVQEKKLEKCFGSAYINVLPGLKYTCEIVSVFAPGDGIAGVKRVLNFFGVRIKSRLDYIFSRNLKVASKEMLDLPGSDHRALIAELEI